MLTDIKAAITAIISVFLLSGSCSAASVYDVIYGHIASYHGYTDETRWLTDAIFLASDTYQVDPILITAVMDSESNFSNSVVSSAGAVGYMQLMPETGEELSINIYDPYSNVMGGTYHLRYMLDAFSGYGDMAVTTAVAAYNAGPQAVKDYGGCPPYSETIHYVNNVYRTYMQLLNQCYYNGENQNE